MRTRRSHVGTPARAALAAVLVISLVGIAVSINVHSATAGSTGALIVQKAASQAGIPYCNGGGGINGPTVGDSSSQCAPGVVGYDCMSVAQYAVYQATGFAIANDGENLPGGTAYTGVGTLIQHQSTVAEDEAGLQPGDVVLFGGYSTVSYAHDGIWAGGDLIWDASGTPGQVQEVSFEYLMSIYNNAYQGAVRYSGIGLAGPPPPAPSPNGYDLVGSDGGVFVFGGGFYGSLPGLGVRVNDITGMVPTTTDTGYFLVGSDGGVFAFNAPFANSLPGIGVHVADIVGMVPTVSDQGYFLVGRDGGVFSFNAPFENSLPGLGIHVDDIGGIAATPDDRGYWLVGSNGAVYAFGDAHFYGSAPPGAVGITATRDGGGYWVVGANGAVTPFGDAGNFSDLPAIGVAVFDIVGIVVSPDSRGYNLIGSDGGVFSFGDAVYKGSLPGLGVHVDDLVGAVPT
jgi:hypothetical protein